MTPGDHPTVRDPRGSRLAIFEYIGLPQVPSVILCLFRGFGVKYLEMSPRAAGLAFLDRNRTSGRLGKIRWSDLDLDHQYALNNAVLDGNDASFQRELGSSRLIRLFGDLAGSGLARVAYVKYHALDGYEQELKSYQLRETAARSVAGRAVIILRNPALAGKLAAGPNPGFRIPIWNRFSLVLKSFAERVGYGLVMVLFPFYILVLVGIPSRGREPSRFKAGIRVYRTDFGCHRRYRSTDFLVDGKDFDARNTLICAETPLEESYRECLRKKGYTVAWIDRSLRGVTERCVGRWLKRGIPFWLRCIPRGFIEKPSTVRRTLEFLKTYLLWEAFCERFSLSHYVTYNDALPKDIVRNIVLERHGVGTWYYEHSSNTSNLFVPQVRGCQEYRTVHYSHLAFGHLVCWGDKIRRYYAMHPQEIGSYDLLGCPWSEHIDEIRRHPGENGCLARAQEHFRRTLGDPPRRIISVFDTSASDSSILSERDLVGFLEGIARLIGEETSSGFIFKMKYEWPYLASVWPELLPLYEKIRDSPRCLLIDALTTEVSEAVAASDLVISACFTSPTIEGLGARQKGIFYDAAGSFRGCYYDAFPDLVAHDYEDLWRLIRHWLDSVTPGGFDRYLDTYVKGELDAFVDGKGITRFRELLLR
ncbi:MAG TPA: polysaccharide biosynthesis PFTS motif protein [Methanomicrobiales archaeon]|nr:polysaccharide biosynthesis PFTS motif protein [Methanomicrobiales archaeon]